MEQTKSSMFRFSRCPGCCVQRFIVVVLLVLAYVRPPCCAADEHVSPVYVPEGGPEGDLEFAESGPLAQIALPTVTVRGFLNFRTTVDGTVIVFTPASEAPSEDPAPTPPTTSNVQKTKDAGEASNVVQDIGFGRQDNALLQKGDLDRQQARETFRDINAVFPSSENVIQAKVQPTTILQTSKMLAKTEPVGLTQTPVAVAGSGGQYPTGLVTVLGGTSVEKGATTIHETKVIGTYIDGKYAQILQSTSRIIFGGQGSSGTVRTSITPSPSTPPAEQSTAPSYVLGSRDSRDKSNQVSSSTSSFSRSRNDGSKDRSTQQQQQPQQQQIRRGSDDSITTNTVLQSSFRIPDGSPGQRASSVATQSLDSARASSSSTYQHSAINKRLKPSTTAQPHHALQEDENTLLARGSHRRQSHRLRYILPRQQSQTVRLNRFKVKLTLRPGASDIPPGSGGQGPDDNEHNHFRDSEFEDDLSLTDDSGRLIFQKSTITSEITLHVGRRKSVRTITITTSVPRTKDPSDPDSNVLIEPTQLAAANNALLATSTADYETPSVVISRTYSTTERTWRTSVIPFFDGLSTATHTVTESFFIRKLITAYKTMPPGGDFDLFNETEIDPLPTLDSSPNQQTALLQGVVPLPPSPQQHLLQTPLPQAPLLQTSGLDSSYLQLSSPGGGPLQITNPLLTLGAALSQNPLAAVYLGLHQLNRQVTQYSTVVKTSSYTTTDTVYSTKVVRFYDGRQTRFRTLSEPISTTERVVTTYSTALEPYINPQVLQQQHQLQQLIGTNIPPLVPTQVPQFSTITSSYTKVTTATSYSTKIYTLIYNGFSTKYRTVTSTSTYPTTLTTFSTTQVPIAASVAPAPAPLPAVLPLVQPAPPVPLPVPVATAPVQPPVVPLEPVVAPAVPV